MNTANLVNKEPFTVNSEFTDSILNEKHKLHYNYIGQGYEFIVMQTKSTLNDKTKKKRSRGKKQRSDE
jgi:hypothetical protein